MVRIQEETRPIDIYSVELMPEAQRGFSALRKANQRLVSDGIDGLETNPRPFNSKLLVKAENLRRLTIGDYRVLYGITESKRTVTIEMIRHRSVVYTALAALALTVRAKGFSK
jgi:mRNA interferase RelE/StbE